MSWKHCVSESHWPERGRNDGIKPADIITSHSITNLHSAYLHLTGWMHHVLLPLQICILTSYISQGGCLMSYFHYWVYILIPTPHRMDAWCLTSITGFIFWLPTPHRVDASCLTSITNLHSDFLHLTGWMPDVLLPLLSLYSDSYTSQDGCLMSYFHYWVYILITYTSQGGCLMSYFHYWIYILITYTSQGGCIMSYFHYWVYILITCTSQGGCIMSYFHYWVYILITYTSQGGCIMSYFHYWVYILITCTSQGGCIMSYFHYWVYILITCTSQGGCIMSYFHYWVYILISYTSQGGCMISYFHYWVTSTCFKARHSWHSKFTC